MQQVDTLGRYRIEKELGRGAMGRVFLAYDPQIDRRVAIKTIQIFASLPESERAQARDRFLREARSAGKLLHPGIVTIFDVGEADGVPYLAMEYIEGWTLDVYCRPDELLPVPSVVALIAAAADALGFAHRNGIIHRDVKPANIMKVGETAVKIMDFGLAKGPTTSMTHDGSLLGTPNYMSPEQIRGEALDGRTDLFSLAVVLYEMLTGERPFAGDSVSSVLYRIVNEPPREAALHLDRVPPALAAFLERALDKSPDKRFPDGKTFAIALRRAGAEVQAATMRGPRRSVAAAGRTVASDASSSVARRRSSLPWIVGLVVVVAGIAAWLVPKFLGPPPVPLAHATVRAEPASASLSLNGTPLTTAEISFPAAGPYGVLTATQGCREAKHRIEPADAGREIVIAVDPVTAEVSVDPGVAGAKIALNGKDAGAAPASLTLDLCRDNAIDATADGYRPAHAAIPPKATPLEARNAAAGLRLEAIPMGRLVLPATRVPVTFSVDGQPARGAALDLPAGTHEVKAASAEHFVELTTHVDVPPGGSATPRFEIPALARLVVQTFPPNCRVSLQRDGSPWREIGETPLRYELAPGRYAVHIVSALNGETRDEQIDLRAGINAPLRVSFGRSAR